MSTPSITLHIPDDLLPAIKIPQQRMATELLKELALQLYRERLISFANAHRLANMSKIEFHYLLGEREIPRHYDEVAYDDDLQTLAQLLENGYGDYTEERQRTESMMGVRELAAHIEQFLGR